MLLLNNKSTKECFFEDNKITRNYGLNWANNFAWEKDQYSQKSKYILPQTFKIVSMILLLFLTRKFNFYLNSKLYIYLQIKLQIWEVNIWPLGFSPINIKIFRLQIILRLNFTFNFAKELKFHSLFIFGENYRSDNYKKKEVNGLDGVFWVLATWMYSLMIQIFPVNPNTFKNISC